MKLWYLTRLFDLDSCENTPNLHEKRYGKYKILGDMKKIKL